MSQRKKILIIAHGHPDHAKGGGEMAAYNLHLGLEERDEFDTVFLARHDRDDLLHGGTPFAGTGRPKEILFHSTMPDWFRFSQPDKARVWRDFREVLEVCRPDIVHFHHYVHLGLELIREVRSFDPSISIVLTLHEYLAICHNHGQMVKAHDQSLCHKATPSACNRCFPERSPQDFMLRERFIKSHFDLVDRFISPSEFLKQRHVDWGVPAERIEVIENLLTPEARREARESAENGTASERDANVADTVPSGPDGSLPKAPGKRAKVGRRSDDHPVRLAFFGQINAFKGLDYLLEAIDQLPKGMKRRVRLDINGSGLDRQPPHIRGPLEARIVKLGDQVRLRGPYRPDELGTLMASADWMVIPSAWWENSPVVILEARRYGLPVIAANIGGMAEKIEHGKTGLHFMARRADSLVEQIVYAANHPEMRERCSAALRASWQPDRDLERHVALYGELRGERRERPLLKAVG